MLKIEKIDAKIFLPLRRFLGEKRQGQKLDFQLEKHKNLGEPRFGGDLNNFSLFYGKYGKNHTRKEMFTMPNKIFDPLDNFINSAYKLKPKNRC